MVLIAGAYKTCMTRRLTCKFEGAGTSSDALMEVVSMTGGPAKNVEIKYIVNTLEPRYKAGFGVHFHRPAD